MIPHSKNATITIGGVDNATEFSIATTGKAFRILIDGLYSDKVLAPVRELMTNAVDGHVAGGYDGPFLVTVPTTLDPTFGVRDYGSGMDHETIVGLYTTLFASSKDDSNDQTGMLGLGSKSPFAYTDTFTVEAFDGTNKRVYMAYMKDDVPNISLVGEVPTDEPRGISVQFPVQVHDRRKFEDAIYKVMAGLDVLPLLDGVELDFDRLPEVVREGAGWRLIKGGESEAHVFIRQGGVLYKAERQYVTQLPTPRGYYDSYSIILDAPIGSCEVTPSREALSYDEQTVENISQLSQDAFADMMTQLKDEYDAISSQYEHQHWLTRIPDFVRENKEVREAFPTSAFQARFDLMPGHFKRAEAWTPEDMKREQKNKHLYPLAVKEQTMVAHIESADIEHLRFVLDDGVTPRRRSRMLDWAKEGRKSRRLMIPAGPHQAVVVKRLKALMHLKDEQFVPVADTYDQGPRTTGRSGSKGVKKSELVEKLEAGAIWCERHRSDFYLRSVDGVALECRRLDEAAYNIGQIDGVDYSEILFLTQHQVETLKPDWNQSLTRKVMEAAAPWVAPTYASQHNWHLERALREHKCSHSAALTAHLGFKDQRTMTGSPLVNQMAARAANNLPDPDIDKVIAEARKNYPALFPEPLANDEVGDYLAMQDEIRNNPTTEEV